MNLTFDHSATIISTTMGTRSERTADIYSVEGAPTVTIYGQPYRLRFVEIDETGAVIARFGRVTRKSGEWFKSGEGFWNNLRASNGAAVLAHGLTPERADEIVNALESALPVPDVHVRPIAVPMIPADDYRREHYGIISRSVFVYRVAGSYAPTRIVVWDNTRRPNPRNGESVRWGQFGPIDGGNGRYLDPSNRATDAPVSVLLTPESTVISAHRDGTGTAASGQVWAEGGERVSGDHAGDARRVDGRLTLRTGDALALISGDGTTRRVRVRLTNNGHGVAE